MPTVFAHAAVAWGLARAARAGRPPDELQVFVERAAMALAVLPDADVLAFALGVPYEAPLGHRGLSHSLLAALVLGGGVWALLRWASAAGGRTRADDRQGREDGASRAPPAAEGGAGELRKAGWLELVVLVLAAASHGLLDCLTDGGRGVGLLLPFEGTRWFAPARPIPVSPIGLLGFLAEGWPVLFWECLLLGPVAALGVAIGAAWPARVRLGAAAAALLVGGLAWSHRL